VNDRADLVMAKNSFDRRGIPHVRLVEHRTVVCDLRYAIQDGWFTVAQVVYDNGLDTSLNKCNTSV
jgi:hypothetical protein